MPPPGPKYTSQNLPWWQVCEYFKLCEKSSVDRNRVSTRDLTERLLSLIPRTDVLPLLRIVACQLDTNRSYWIKEKRFADLYAEACGLAKQSVDYKRLLHFKNPTIAPNKAVGDFGNVLEDILEGRCATEDAAKRVTLGDVNAFLDGLAATARDKGAASAHLRRVITMCTANQNKWIARVILKDLKVKVSADTVLRAYHPQGPERYSNCTSLEIVATDCVDRERVVQVMQVTHGLAVLPMLAERVGSIEDLAEVMRGKHYSAETKYDGERIQVHRKGNDLRMFTRKGTDYTALYAGVMRDKINEAVRADNYILDGEMLAWDPTLQRFIPFGSNRTVAMMQGMRQAREARQARDRDRDPRHPSASPAKRQRVGEADRGRNTGGGADVANANVVDDGGGGGGNDDDDDDDDDGSGALSGDQHLCFVIFDVLMLDDENLMGFPLRTRRGRLRQVVRDIPRWVELSKGTDVRDMSHVTRMIDAACDNLEEGLLLKDMDWHYEPNARNNHWIKLKPEYLQYGEPMDLVVLGGLWGNKDRGRTELLSRFILGVVRDRNEKPPVYLSAGKVGTGYSVHQLSELMARYSGRTLATRPSAYLVCLDAKQDDTPDLWFPPEDAPVFSVTCPELVPSVTFKTGYTIRFPRVEHIRDDRSPESALDLEGYMSYVNNVRQRRIGSGAATGRRSGPSDAASRSAKTRGRRGTGAPKVLPQFVAADLSGVVVRTSILANFAVCVVSVREPPDGKAAAEKLVHALGGRIVQNPVAPRGINNVVVVSDSASNARVANIVRAGTMDVVSPAWLAACEAAGIALWPVPSRYLVHSCAETRGRLRDEAARGEHLRAILRRRIEAGEDEPISGHEMVTAETVLFQGLRVPRALFRRVVVYFDRREDPADPSSEWRRSNDIDIAWYAAVSRGAVAAETVADSSLTHIVVDDDEVTAHARLEILNRALRAAPREYMTRPLFVRASWIHDCIAAGSLFDVSKGNMPLSERHGVGPKPHVIKGE